MSTRRPPDRIERALVRIRRDQQANSLQRRAAADHGPTGSGGAVVGPADAARMRYLDALDGAVEGLPISDVARAIGVDRPRASRLTNDLCDAELVERRPDPDDARFALVRLTDRGRSLVDELRRTRRRAVVEALRGLSRDEAEVFADLLERFVDAWPRPDAVA